MRMNLNLANGINTEILSRYYFSLKGLAILHQDRRGQVKTLIMEHFNGILFGKSAPAKNSIPISHSDKTIILQFYVCECHLTRVLSQSGLADDNGETWAVHKISNIPLTRNLE